MTQIFISHSHEDVACAEQIRVELERAGYTVWKDTQSIQPGSPSYVRAIEDGIKGCAALVVLWSESAQRSQWVEREVLYGEQLKRPIFPIFIDDTPQGVLLIATQYVKATPLCVGAVAQLLPHLPPINAEPELLEAGQLLGHAYTRERQKGVELADQLLAQGKYHEPLMAMLEDVARKDLVGLVRTAAQAVLAKYAPQDTSSSAESRHIFGVRCPNGHVHYFNKWRVCPDDGTFKRSITMRGDRVLDDMYLTCETCGVEFVVPVDCEGYKPK